MQVAIPITEWESRLDDYLTLIEGEAGRYGCHVSKENFAQQLCVFFIRLNKAIEQGDVYYAAAVLGEMRAYVNENLYGYSNFGDVREISFYDTNSGLIEKREIHVLMDELKDFIANEIFSAETVGQEAAAKAQEAFYPPSQPSTWVKVTGIAALAVAAYAIATCRKSEDGHSGKIEEERAVAAISVEARR